MKLLKILVVEDSPIIRTAYTSFLKKHYQRVDSAADGLMALKMAKEKYDVILMDIYLPHMNGIEICERLKRRKDVGEPIIIGITSDMDAERQQMCLAAGMSEVLLKQVADPKKIQTVIEKYYKTNHKSRYQ